MEFIEIVDENDVLTGEIMKKKLAHNEGKYHRIAHVWLINDMKEVLIQKRSFLNKTHQNCWDISAKGHIRAGESVEDGALRELKEEIGVDAILKDLIYLTKIRKETNPQNKEFAYIYIIKSNLKIEEFKFLDNEVSEVKYVYYEDLEKMIKKKEKDLLIRLDECIIISEYLNGGIK
jgi:isopentenyl-diphosphate delta-isomerase type 1